MFCLLTYMVVLTFQSAWTEIFYTDPNKEVSSERDGSWLKPFHNVSVCVQALENAGDECQIRKGVYREEIDVSGLKGTADKPIVIRGYGKERPTLDGTVDIAPESGAWQKNGEIYFGTISHVIWQLFFDDLMMTNARWPNANWSNKTVFDGRYHWSKTSKKSKKGKIVGLGDSLKDSGKNMTGAMAVMNIGSWNTFVAPIEWHVPGQNYFTYNDTFGKYHVHFKGGRYFIESKLDLLDAPEEWFFDETSKMLYFIPPKDKEFTSTTKLRGKVQTYALTISDSQHVVLKNLDFFGTTLKGASSYKKNKFIDQILLDTLNFIHPCASKRMLQEKSVTECTKLSGRRSSHKPTVEWGSFTFFNNTFLGADGVPLAYEGSRVRMENNLFEYNDWTSANSLVGEGGHGTLETFSVGDTYIRNTFRYNGESHGLRPGFRSNVTLNRVIGQCWGLQANDGAGIQVTINMQPRTTVDRNWVHDSPKYGVRFDGQPPRIGHHGTMKNNVLFRLGSGGGHAKGDFHTVLNNLAFDSPDGEARKFPGCSLCVWKHVRGNAVEINHHSTVVDNLADAANGGKVFKNGRLVKPIKVWPLNGANITGNIVDTDIKSMLHDPDNYDFRPLHEDITAGPYLYSTALSTYWIPGRKLYKASSPVPPHKAHRILAAHRDALMWLNAYGCDTHHVYLGTTNAAVKDADDKSTEFLGTVTDGNVMYLKETLKVGEKYFWRVDAECGDNVFKGDIWRFITV